MAARRRRRSSRKLSLDFGGPPLALPGEELPPVEERSVSPSGAIDLGDLDRDDSESVDGWTRLRDSEKPEPAEERPARPRSVSPPAMMRNEALDLVTRRSRPPSNPNLDLSGEMNDRYALGDFTGALRIAELVLGQDPENSDAQRCADDSRQRLVQHYSARLRSIAGLAAEVIGSHVPRMSVPEHEIRWLGLDHRQGFLLSRVDGAASIDDLIDLTGMNQLEVLRTLVELLEAKAISFE